jgi:hypothetical protein
MPTSFSPYYIAVAVFLGSILSPVLGWARARLDSKNAAAASPAPAPIEQFNYKQLLASAVIGFVAALFYIGQFATVTTVNLADLELALVSGFGADKIIKNFIGI